MEVKRIGTLAIEIFKTLNNLNLSFMKEIFYRSPYVSHMELNIYVQSHKTKNFGYKSLKSLKIQETSLSNFKSSIKKWFGPKCMCNLCSFNNDNVDVRL